MKRYPVAVDLGGEIDPSCPFAVDELEKIFRIHVHILGLH
jgi:hypothetical protein